MSESQSPGVHALEEPVDDVNRYTLHTQVEILYELRMLAKRGDMLTVYFNQGKDFLLTTLLGVRPDSSEFLCDVSPNQETNARFLQSGRNVFIASPEGVRVQFVAGAPKRIKHEGREAFAVPFPAELVKLQRREYFRVETPLVKPCKCVIPRHAKGRLVVPVYDLSLGGMGLTASDPEDFEPLQVYEACSVELPDHGNLVVTIEIRNTRELVSRTGALSYRVGCRFVGLPQSMHPMLQRYMVFMERERKNLAR